MSTPRHMDVADKLEALHLIVARDFVQVRAGLTRKLGGDGNSSIMISLIDYKTAEENRNSYELDGHRWWAATYEDLAEASGFTVDQVKRTLAVLTRLGMIVTAKHRHAGNWDQRKSYRLWALEDENASEPLENTDSADLPNGSGGSAKSIRQDGPIQSADTPNVLSYKDLETHNTDSVGGDEEEVDKSGPFRLTSARRKLVTDAMVEVGQAYAVQSVLDHLEMQTWQTAEREIQSWCGIQAAARNGQGYRRGDIDELLVEAGLFPTSDAAWNAWLATDSALPHGHGPGCHYDEVSGYCSEHGQRSPE